MKNEKIGLIGFGAIGQEVYKKISRKTIKGYNVIGVFSDDINLKKLPKKIKCKSFEELLKKKPTIIIEVASVEACKDYAEKVLKSKIDFVCLSVCSFADRNFFKRISNLVKKIKNKIYIPTGAIAGIDAISSASLSNELKYVKECIDNGFLELDYNFRVKELIRDCKGSLTVFRCNRILAE